MLIKFLISLNLFDLKMVIIPGITQSIIIIVALFFYIISDNASEYMLHFKMTKLLSVRKILTISFMNIALAIKEENSTGWKSMITKCNIDSRTAK